MNDFLTAGRKKNGEVEDELDRSLEGMDHSDEQFDKGKSKRDVHTIWMFAWHNRKCHGGHKTAFCYAGMKEWLWSTCANDRQS